MNLLHAIFLDPFAQMVSAPDLLVQTIWEGFVGGVLYALIALGFVLIYKASGVFNFAQGIMMVFAALTLVGLHEKGVPAWFALLRDHRVMYVLARRHRAAGAAPARQPARHHAPDGDVRRHLFPDRLRRTRVRRQSENHDHAGAVSAERRARLPYSRRLGHAAEARHRRGGDRDRHGRRARACSSRRRASAAPCARSPTIIRRRCRSAFRSIRSGSSSGSPPGVVALATGIMWGARSEVSFALQVIALKALPVLILGGLTSIPGAIVGGLIIGIGEKLGEFYWGPLMGGGIESWLAYFIALVFLLFRPQGLFGERIIERI